MADHRFNPRPKDDREPALRADGVTKSYGELVALAPLDLSVPAGQVVAVVGHNGSGKSTLLQLAAGLLDASDGVVTVHGDDAGSLPARAAVSYIGDNPILYDDLSVWEHLEYLGRLHGVSDWESRSTDLLERFGLTDRADDLPLRFSRGLRQKAALVVGLVRDASVLLIDEPFVGLDATGKETLLAVVGDQRERGATVLLATHDLEILPHADRCVALHNGSVVHDGDAVPSAVTTVVG